MSTKLRDLNFDMFRDLTGSDGLPPDSVEESQTRLVNLWLSGETNEARLLLCAYEIGLQEGIRRTLAGKARAAAAAKDIPGLRGLQEELEKKQKNALP